MTPQEITFERAGRTTRRVGLGCMGLSWGYLPDEEVDRNAQVTFLRDAAAAGVDLFDTSDMYGRGHNEELVGEALASRDDILIATKGGLVVDSLAPVAMHNDASPEYLRKAVEDSLGRLRRESIDLYYLHRLDPNVPVEESVGALSELVTEGKLKAIGLSEVTVAQADRAQVVHPISAIQSELSVWTRDALGVGPGEARGNVVDWCGRNGAAFVAFSPLGRGFLSGDLDVEGLGQQDFRRNLPRFQSEASQANRPIQEAVQRVATGHGAAPAQVALAWVLVQGEHVVAIPGTSKLEHCRTNLGALSVSLGAGDLADLDVLPEAVGSRY